MMSLLKEQLGEMLTSLVWRMLRSIGLVDIILLLQAMSWLAGNVKICVQALSLSLMDFFWELLAAQVLCEE